MKTESKARSEGHPLVPRWIFMRDKVSEFSAIAALICLGVYVTFVSLNVFMRYVFNAPIALVTDLSELFPPFALGVCFPIAILSGTTLSIEFLGEFLGRKAFLFLDGFGRVVTFIVLALVAYQMIDYAIDSYADGFTTGQFFIPTWPVWAGVAVGFVVSVPGALIAPISHSLQSKADKTSQSGSAP